MVWLATCAVEIEVELLFLVLFLLGGHSAEVEVVNLIILVLSGSKLIECQPTVEFVIITIAILRCLGLLLPLLLLFSCGLLGLLNGLLELCLLLGQFYCSLELLFLVVLLLLLFFLASGSATRCA